MWIKKVKISNFRNYKFEEFYLDNNVNVFFGENAQGKTNIIESIFLCSMGKSFRTSKDKELINLNSDSAIVEVDFQKSDRDGNVKIVLENKKSVFVNGVKLKKLSELLGNINVVLMILIF